MIQPTVRSSARALWVTLFFTLLIFALLWWVPGVKKAPDAEKLGSSPPSSGQEMPSGAEGEKRVKFVKAKSAALPEIDLRRASPLLSAREAAKVAMQKSLPAWRWILMR